MAPALFPIPLQTTKKRLVTLVKKNKKILQQKIYTDFHFIYVQ